MPDLSKEELAQAAAEAGITPEELRSALVHRDSDQLQTTKSSSGRPVVQAKSPRPAPLALQDLHWTMSRQVGYEQQENRNSQLVYTHEEFGFNLILSAAPDGPGQSISKIEIDVSPRLKRVKRSLGWGFGTMFAIMALRTVTFQGGLLAIGLQLSAILLPLALMTFFVLRHNKKYFTRIAEKQSNALLAQALGPSGQ